MEAFFLDLHRRRGIFCGIEFAVVRMPSLVSNKWYICAARYHGPREKQVYGEFHRSDNLINIINDQAKIEVPTSSNDQRIQYNHSNQVIDQNTSKQSENKQTTM